MNDSKQTRFVRFLVLIALINCNKIALVGQPNDYYRIYFFTDAYRYYPVDLKGPGYLLPKRFKNAGKTLLNRGLRTPLRNLVDKTTAHALLSDCPYEPLQEDQYVAKPNTAVLSWVNYILTCKVSV